MRKILIAAALLLCFCFADTAYASDITDSQARAVGADRLSDGLPEETADSLEQIGIKSADTRSVLDLTMDRIFGALLGLSAEKSKNPVTAAFILLGMVILSALLREFNSSLHEGAPQEQVFQFVIMLSVCTVILTPISGAVIDTSRAIEGFCSFLLMFVPVFAGVMTVSGQPVTASAYSLLQVGFAQFFSFVAAMLLTPLINIYLAFCVVGSVSEHSGIPSITALIQRVITVVLLFCSTVFIGLLTVQSFVASSSDALTVRTGKFLIESFVPVVGGAVSEALLSIQGSLKLLKSSVGAFGIISAAVTFLPVLVELAIWNISLALCAAFADMFSLGQVSSLLKSAANAVKLLLAIVLICGVLIVITTGIMLVIGMGNG